MKRKILCDIECISGIGWVSEEAELDCPICNGEIKYVAKLGASRVICGECKTEFKVEYGQQNFHRLVIKEKKK